MIVALIIKLHVLRKKSQERDSLPIDRYFNSCAICFSKPTHTKSSDRDCSWQLLSFCLRLSAKNKHSGNWYIYSGPCPSQLRVISPVVELLVLFSQQVRRLLMAQPRVLNSNMRTRPQIRTKGTYSCSEKLWLSVISSPTPYTSTQGFFNKHSSLSRSNHHRGDPFADER